ncbi:MAG: hypothetical protein JNG82_00825 [Opitutaceae bacterium]|nr:hypothetical protein [Opitutaceae bacterium]
MITGGKRLFSLIVLSLALAGCASYNDLNGRKGMSSTGGFRDQKLGDGLFLITAMSGFAPWENQAGARKTFSRRAVELCGDDRFTVLWFDEQSMSATGLDAHIVTTAIGYALDKDSPLSGDEAKRIINAERERLSLQPIFR